MSVDEEEVRGLATLKVNTHGPVEIEVTRIRIVNISLQSKVIEQWDHCVG